ncbi:hypothetical protein AAFN60_08510 [Roseibacillus persicicus]|uniref:hypothetical protein n=1 Tax=Roseibacillus persicicus TaxID=454148 RepID=UPI00398A597B
MNTEDQSWKQQFLAGIAAIDCKEAPHGLYGLREFYRKDGKLPPLSELLCHRDSPVSLLNRFGWTAGYCHVGSRPSYRESFSFDLPNNETVDMRIVTFASTKVRSYGGAYHLDKAHGKTPPEKPKMDSIVPKVSRHTSDKLRPSSWSWTQACLFIAHVARASEFEQLLGKAAETTFLTRYKLQLDEFRWEDRFGRDFSTGFFLWSPLD